jgi:hypothetical protein
MKFVISYAYDVPHYADFLVDAKDKKDALKKAKEAFFSGKFNGIRGEPDETTRNDRVFVHRAADDYDKGVASI